MEIGRNLEHPAVARCLRTGYPYIVKPVKPVDTSLTVTDDEFAEIVSKRLEKRRESESR